ncbi:hypothetical protein HYH03_011373 [Edaphochlamys debaryana]|uniref:Uncharacterized protein n=1 Tax=Edaphochlamys debaryana TaxID=47281 RepID=A0A835Y381_9CHLO|nr:hypothetical protein HYH03_011373 [Edaphochlamys debaryana]|eukprot:KAG2490249.1 hypothetical protein HYH03_011373 [Edaphochlamys debaryana]
MPPKGRGRGAGGSGGSGSGSAASSGAAAPPPSAPAAASLLSAELRSAFRELPGYADAVVPAPIQRGAQPAAAPAGSRLSPSQEHRLERFLARLLIDIEGLPVMRPDIAAALAELLSQEPAAAAALLKLQAAALRPCGGGGAEALTAEHWRLLHKAIYTMLVKVMPLPPSRHALSVLRFVRAMLRAQPFHALSRQLTAMTTALEAGRHGGGDGSSSGGRGGGSSSGGGGAGSSSGGGRGRNGGVRSHPAGLETGAGGGHDAGGFRLAPKTADAADKVLMLGVFLLNAMNLDALPPAAPPEVAAALAGGLLPQLMTHIGAAAYLQKDYVYLRTLFAACDEARPDGSGLALFLTPLLAYGDPGEGEELVEVLTALIQLRPEASGGGPSSSGTHCESYWRAAAALLHATAGALGRCRYVGPTTEAPAGLAEAAEGGGEDPAMRTGAGTAAAVDPPPDPQQQLRRLLAPFLAAGQAL